MKWNEVGTQVCSLARSLSVVGDRWTLLFLRESMSGTTRFEDFLSGTGASRALGTDVKPNYRPGTWATARKATKKRLRPSDQASTR
jgi:hypothetical protein